MSQPAWECIAQLGDKNPIDHGGYRAVGDYHGFENLDSYPQFRGALHKACDWSSRAQQRWAVERSAISDRSRA